MGRITLQSAPYTGRSLIASGQEAVNLYPEKNDAQAPVPITWYPVPGSSFYADPNFARNVRCTYRTRLGTAAFVVVGPRVYLLDNAQHLTLIGFIADRQSQVYIADNGLVAVLVDGSPNGYAINLTTNAFAPIIDPSFYGADFVIFLDTFFVFNRPATNQFYISLSNVDYALLTAGTSFDPLDIAAKSGSADPIVGIATVHQELWLIGALTTEVWIGTGAADFFFQQVQGAYIQHGCIAPYSIATADVLIFCLMQDDQGKLIVTKGQGYDVSEISTPRLVAEFNSYVTVADSIGFCFQIADHAFYALVFPEANKGWLYDLKSGWWNEWNYTDDDGVLNRPRANCCMFAYGSVIIGDWENGQLLKLDPNVYTDNGAPITCIKTFSHMMGQNYERITYKNFDADMEVGTVEDDSDPQVSLSWSDNRGKSYGNPVEQSMGKTGEYDTTISWNRLGMARDRVFKLQWSAPVKTALNGGFVEVVGHKT